MLAILIRLLASVPFVFFALILSADNPVAAVILAVIAGAILWPLVRAPK